MPKTEGVPMLLSLCTSTTVGNLTLQSYHSHKASAERALARGTHRTSLVFWCCKGFAIGGPHHAPAAPGRCRDCVVRIERVWVRLQQSGCQLHCKSALRHLHRYRVSSLQCKMFK